MGDDFFPIFDAHSHFSVAFLDQVLDSYEKCGIMGGINLWGGDYRGYGPYPTYFDEMLAEIRSRGLKQWVPFYWPNWQQFSWRPEAFVEHLCGEMRRFDALGCRGLKVWKDLGMFMLHADGSPATMDDPRLEPVWRTAHELGWTIAVHRADPSNAWNKPVRTGLSREEIYRRRDEVLARHPEIRFILCHNANDIESLSAWAELMARFPNVMSDIGRDPLPWGSADEFRSLFETYADRLMIGTDLGMPSQRPPDHEWNAKEGFGRWRTRIRSWGLSDSAFRKITWENGERLFLKPTKG